VLTLGNLVRYELAGRRQLSGSAVYQLLHYPAGILGCGDAASASYQRPGIQTGSVVPMYPLQMLPQRCLFIGSCVAFQFGTEPPGQPNACQHAVQVYRLRSLSVGMLYQLLADGKL
jgi:hypothetical protein